ncbi:MAG TPA: WYL domain-containing protein [Microlunatus sp.]
MTRTANRLLDLLATLQSRPTWTGAELADRFGISTRTVRNDIDRLRELGYPVEATQGRAGGYRLGAGGRMPPLLLDNDEVVAVAVGLRAASGVAGIEDACTRALAKLEQILPPRLRPIIDALGATTERAPENIDTDAPDPQVDADALSTIATAVRAIEWLRFDYDGQPTLVEPYRVLSWRRRWYLVGRDPATDRWDVYRVDRMSLRMRTHRRFRPVPPPEGDYAAFTMRQVAFSGWNVHARLRIAAPASQVLDRINPTVGVVEAVDDATSVLFTGADSLDTVAAYIGMLNMDFTVESPAELVPLLATLAQRYARAAKISDHRP